MLEALRDELGGLPLIAEDLGIITPDVEALRDGFDLPGMAILQFAFGDPTGNGEHAYLPHNHRKNLVVYPGTHDNDTLAGWYFWANERTKHHVRTYLAVPDAEVAYAMLRAAWRSVGDNAVVAMQDLLFLDGSARMNTPGVAKGNWAWRAGHGFANISLAQRLSDEMRLSGRARGRLR
jgi:4-alpha-glucanotransferase